MALSLHSEPWDAHRTKDCTLENNKVDQPATIYGPFLYGGRENLCDSLREKARGYCYLSNRDDISHQALSMLPVSNHDILSSWRVHIGQESHSLRSTLLRRHKAHMRQCPLVQPANQVAGIREVRKMRGSSGIVPCPLRQTELFLPGKGTKW